MTVTNVSLSADKGLTLIAHEIKKGESRRKELLIFFFTFKLQKVLRKRRPERRVKYLDKNERKCKRYKRKDKGISASRWLFYYSKPVRIESLR
jgi:hypothetical protein